MFWIHVFRKIPNRQLQWITIQCHVLSQIKSSNNNKIIELTHTLNIEAVRLRIPKQYGQLCSNLHRGNLTSSCTMSSSTTDLLTRAAIFSSYFGMIFDPYICLCW